MNKEDLIREFQFEHERCNNYFDLMYRALNFTFIAIISLVVFSFKNFNNNANNTYQLILLELGIPACIYVFGILYAYNAYALAVCGERAEIIHEAIYKSSNTELKLTEDEKNIVVKYVVTNRLVTMLAYGVPLGFFLVSPLTCCIIGWISEYFSKTSNVILIVLSAMCITIYFFLMAFIIYAISKKHFNIFKIQKSTCTEK